MTEINNDQLDRLGCIADGIDNLNYALKLPLNDSLHVKALRECLPAKAKELQDLYREISGEDPWKG